MGKMLIVLNLNDVMEDVTEGGAPYDEVKMLYCENGEAGEEYTFGERWLPLLSKYFYGGLPAYVKIEKDAMDADPQNSDQALLQRIERDIQTLRARAVDPFDLHLDQTGVFSIEIAPTQMENGQVQHRASLCHKNLGYTTVDYSAEGLSLYVYDNGDELDSVHEAHFSAEDLQREQEEESKEDSSKPAA